MRMLVEDDREAVFTLITAASAVYAIVSTRGKKRILKPSQQGACWANWLRTALMMSRP